MIESIVVAFVLTFLFRTFNAEPFVIPTGSMAPTLMGRHKDLVCPQCGFPYQASASDEVDEAGNGRNPAYLVHSTVCPMCRFQADLASSAKFPSFKGDRILVGKYFYDFVEPRRWDVAVFKFPGQAWMNYIKRIVGLPGETIRVHEGKLYVKPPARNEKLADFTIARKPPNKLLALLQTVHDNDYQAPALNAIGWPARWQPEPVMHRILAQGDVAWPPQNLADVALPAGSWRRTDGHRTLITDGAAPGEAWIRYGHFVPSDSQWERIRDKRSLTDDPPCLQTIKDFVAYNAYQSNRRNSADFCGIHWVSDLAVEMRLDIQGASGEVLLELLRGRHRFTCRIDVATGQAMLSVAGHKQLRTTTATNIRGPGQYNLMFSDIDQQLLLWVNRQVVAKQEYPFWDEPDPQNEDFSPIGLGTRGVALRAEHVKVWRDIYYTPDRNWPSEDFPLAADQFFVLGDNSAQSKDGRLWPGESQYLGGPSLEHYVRRELLIGKALFVYWPHSWDSVTLGRWTIPFPFFPNVQQMRIVR